MESMNVLNMTPKQVLVKEAFKRAIPTLSMTEGGVIHRTGDAGSLATERDNDLNYELYTQSDFLREFDVNSHKINSIKYYPNPLSKDGTTGKYYRKVKTRTAIAWQERILVKRLTTLTGNNVNLRIANADDAGSKQELLNLYREGWEIKNIENAIYEAFLSDGKTGDCAICFYLKDKKIGWRSFGFEKGDVLYPHYDKYTGQLAVFGRKYSSRDIENNTTVEYLDVWDDKFYARYRYDKEGIKGAINGVKTIFGLDGWKIDQPATPHGFPRIPVAYDRYGEPFWAKSQALIESHEMALSQLCENNMAYALRILYAFGAEMNMKSTIDGTPTQINSANTDAKVGFLEPADASNSFTLQLNTLEKNIMRCSFAVETPEIKSGSDMSSLTVKMLYADSYQKALLDAQHFQGFLDDIVEIFKWGYGLELGRSSDFETLKIKAEIYPYIFMSETEQVANIMQLVSVGALSKKSASEMAYDLGYGVIAERGRVLQEEHDELLSEEASKTLGGNVNDVNLARQRRTE